MPDVMVVGDESVGVWVCGRAGWGEGGVCWALFAVCWAKTGSRGQHVWRSRAESAVLWGTSQIRLDGAFRVVVKDLLGPAFVNRIVLFCSQS